MADPAPPHSQTQWRLTPGCHLYRTEEGDWRVATPDGSFIRLRGSDAVLSDVVMTLDAGTDPDPQVQEVLAELDRRGLAQRPAKCPRIASCTVLVTGNNELSAAVIRCLRPWVQLLYEPELAEWAPGGQWCRAADVVVACSGWLRDARFRELDQWCRRAAMPWQMAYAEGSSFYLGPFAMPGGVSYEDARARRLAASAAPEELLALWGYLDGGSSKPAVPWPDAGGVAVLTGLLVADVLGYLAGRVPPSAGYQLAFDPATSTLDRHPVLPLPPLWRGGDP